MRLYSHQRHTSTTDPDVASTALVVTNCTFVIHGVLFCITVYGSGENNTITAVAQSTIRRSMLQTGEPPRLSRLALHGLGYSVDTTHDARGALELDLLR